jgi:hypothetical protein
MNAAIGTQLLKVSYARMASLKTFQRKPAN